jgi:chloramphenicol-sensitive protein RarD
MSPDAASKARASGVAWATGAYLLWGVFPLYFHALAAVPAPEIIAYRVVCSAVFLALLVSVRRDWPGVVRQLRTPGTLVRLGVSAVFISANWGIYVWAVNAGRVLEASLGYFVNPLVSVLLGVAFLHEPLTRAQKIAVLVAAAGVGSLVVRAGVFPWVAMALAVTFGMYGLIRKRVHVDPTAGLLAEVLLLAPVAALYLATLIRAGTGHFGTAGLRITLLLAATGIVTAVPLLWFAVGVRRLRLSTIGLLQYVNPTAQFAIAVLIFREPFSAAHLVAFGCIWVSLAIYSVEAVLRARAQSQASAAASAAEA